MYYTTFFSTKKVVVTFPYTLLVKYLKGIYNWWHFIEGISLCLHQLLYTCCVPYCFFFFTKKLPLLLYTHYWSGILQEYMTDDIKREEISSYLHQFVLRYCISYYLFTTQKKLSLLLYTNYCLGILEEYMTDDINRRNTLILASSSAQMLCTIYHIAFFLQKMMLLLLYTVRYLRRVFYWLH